MARILVVEDDQFLNKFITGVLNDEGHRVESCHDGLDALGKIYSQEFDVAVLDVVLPHLNGTHLLEAFKKSQPNGMAIIISGQSDLDSAIESIRHGAYEFIRKPLKKDELLKIVSSALEEIKLMKESGYVYKDRRRNDKALIRNGILYAVSDSILAALAFYLAFLGQSAVSARLKLPFLLNNTDLVHMSISLGFCYAFIFVYKKCHRLDLIGTGRELIGHIWRNISMAYLVFLAILFVGKDFHVISERIGVILGYFLGTLFLLANRFFLVPNVLALFGKEGQRNIVIVGSGKSAADVSRQIRRRSVSSKIVGFINEDLAFKDGPGANSRLIASRDDIDRVVIASDVEELFIVRDALSTAEILTLLDRLRGRKLKIVMLGGQEESFHIADVKSHTT